MGEIRWPEDIRHIKRWVDNQAVETTRLAQQLAKALVWAAEGPDNALKLLIAELYPERD